MLVLLNKIVSPKKALDSLAESGKITFKEYGKQKIYLARIDLQIPNTEGMNQMKDENGKLQEIVDEQKRANTLLEGAINSVASLAFGHTIGTQKRAEKRTTARQIVQEVSEASIEYP
nr:homologous-pairing protein 2 homolog [Tanacetum cinerariifolium]